MLNKPCINLPLNQRQVKRPCRRRFCRRYRGQDSRGDRRRPRWCRRRPGSLGRRRRCARIGRGLHRPIKNFVNDSVKDRRHIKFASAILPKGCWLIDGNGVGDWRPAALSVGRQAAKTVMTEICKEIMPLQVGKAGAAINITAGHRGADAGVWVFIDRLDIERGVATARRREGCRAFVTIPAIVQTAGAGDRQKVDLLPILFTDIAKKDVVGSAIQREPPGVAHADRPDFGQGGRVIIQRKGIVAGNGVGGDAGDIDAQNLAKILA